MLFERFLAFLRRCFVTSRSHTRYFEPASEISTPGKNEKAQVPERILAKRRVAQKSWRQQQGRVLGTQPDEIKPKNFDSKSGGKQ